MSLGKWGQSQNSYEKKKSKKDNTKNSKCSIKSIVRAGKKAENK